MTFSRLIGIALCFGVLLGESPATANNGAQLTEKYYDKCCPKLFSIATSVIRKAWLHDQRILASLLRLHFHDCFVTGCDGSNLLNNSTYFVSEKYALINLNSARGFDVIDEIKAALEKECPSVVSCADILAIAAQICVKLGGGPMWRVLLGRRDSKTASLSEANSFIRAFIGELDDLKAAFASKGLNSSDLVALSGAHTTGYSQCRFFIKRLYGAKPDSMMEPCYGQYLRDLCPSSGNGSALVDLDHSTPFVFDNGYFKVLLQLRGLLFTDQVLYSTKGADTAPIVSKFAGDQAAFFAHFGESMRKMGNISPLTGTDGEVRRKCTEVNG